MTGPAVLRRAGLEIAPIGRLFLAVAALALLGAAAPVPVAHADPLADAKAQAQQLQHQVTQLRVQAEQASEHYDALEAQLGQLVGQEITARNAADAARTTANSAQTVAAERARALYMSGGMLGVYASVLYGSDPGHLFSGLHDVQAMSDVDKHAVSTVSAANTQLEQAQASLAALVTHQNDLAAQANDAQAKVEDLLSRQQAALDTANAQVQTLEAQLQAALDAQSAVEAAAQITAATQAALAAGYVPHQPSSAALAAIAAAQSQLGKPYVYGGSGPDTWDCSGLTQFAFRQAGVALPRTAAEQYLAVPTKVPLGELAPGDLLFWATDPSNPASIHHVAIYLGNSQMLAAPHTGTVVRVQPVYLDGYYGAVRPA